MGSIDDRLDRMEKAITRLQINTRLREKPPEITLHEIEFQAIHPEALELPSVIEFQLSGLSGHGKNSVITTDLQKIIAILLTELCNRIDLLTKETEKYSRKELFQDLKTFADAIQGTNPKKE